MALYLKSKLNCPNRFFRHFRLSTLKKNQHKIYNSQGHCYPLLRKQSHISQLEMRDFFLGINEESRLVFDVQPVTPLETFPAKFTRFERLLGIIYLKKNVSRPKFVGSETFYVNWGFKLQFKR